MSAALVCPPGGYCGATGLSSPTECDQGKFCAEGTTSSTAQQSCQAGYFCPKGSAAPTPCPVGYVCASGGMNAPTLCTQGRYCDVTGLSDLSAKLCQAGHYCPTGSKVATQFICPLGSYCLQGVAEPTGCPERRFCGTLGLQTSAGSGECIAGFYCPVTGLSSAFPDAYVASAFFALRVRDFAIHFFHVHPQKPSSILLPHRRHQLPVPGRLDMWRGSDRRNAVPDGLVLPAAENERGHAVRGRLVLLGPGPFDRQWSVSRRLLLPGELDRQQSARVRGGHVLPDRLERAHAVPGGLVLRGRARRHVGRVPRGLLLRATLVGRHAKRVSDRVVLHGRPERAHPVPAGPRVRRPANDELGAVHGGQVLQLDRSGRRVGLVVRVRSIFLSARKLAFHLVCSWILFWG
jgi:hypothetical protein